MLKLVLKLKEVLLLLASDFPTENPSKQKRTIHTFNVSVHFSLGSKKMINYSKVV